MLVGLMDSGVLLLEARDLDQASADLDTNRVGGPPGPRVGSRARSEKCTMSASSLNIVHVVVLMIALED